MRQRFALLALTTSALALAACGDLGDPVEPAGVPACDLLPASLDFGEVAPGEQAERQLVLTNTGAAALSGVLAMDCGGFSIAGGDTVQLAPGASDTLVVRFSPATTGPYGCSWDPGLGCGTVLLSGNGATPVPSYAAEIQPLFDQSCTGSSCHDSSSPAAALDLTEGRSRDALVGVVTTFYAPALRVAPGNPSGSVLWHKVANTGNFGGRMPPGGRFGAEKVELIRAWIAGGAPAN